MHVILLKKWKTTALAELYVTFVRPNSFLGANLPFKHTLTNIAQKAWRNVFRFELTWVLHLTLTRGPGYTDRSPEPNCLQFLNDSIRPNTF